jgi:hypothetical protein
MDGVSVIDEYSSKAIRPRCLKNVQVRLAVPKDNASATECRSITLDGDKIVAAAILCANVFQTTDPICRHLLRLVVGARGVCARS